MGIDYDQLIQLIEQGKILQQKKQEEIEKKKIRIIKAGGGNNPKLSTEQQIVLMLVYLRHNLSFQILGLLFQVSESTAHNLFNYWQKLFQESLPHYSGKQKRHTLKTQFVVLPKGTDIVDVVVGKPGPMSDIKICGQTLPKFKSLES